MHDGSCDKTKSMSLWLHLAINVLSTALLSASNFCMQCLSSPTRNEIDQAHQKHIWMDIGVPSVRNLRRISRNRITLWALLAISSIPLHLLYNSAIFSALSSYEYSVFAVSPGFGNGTLFNSTGVPPYLVADGYIPDPNCYDDKCNDHWASMTEHDQLVSYGSKIIEDVKNRSIWERFENRQCIQTYGREFVSTHGDLLTVSSMRNDNIPISIIGPGGVPSTVQYGPSYNWMCEAPEVIYPPESGSCAVNKILRNASQWQLVSTLDKTAYSTETIQYCLSKRMKEHCRLQFSLVIMIIVIICNIIKAACMVIMVYQHHSQPLVTLGDAIASFLDDPDPMTRNYCLADIERSSDQKWWSDVGAWKNRR